jgi:hypothetical protein
MSVSIRAWDNVADEVKSAMAHKVRKKNAVVSMTKGVAIIFDDCGCLRGSLGKLLKEAGYHIC